MPHAFRPREVRGRVAVRYSGGHHRIGWDGNRGRNDRFGYASNGYDRNGRDRYDTGSFKCRVESGRIVGLDFSGIDRL